jgi:hypothetical protein
MASIDPDDLVEVANDAEPEVAQLLRSAKVSAVFRTSMGRSVAATLAALCGGVVVDGQQGEVFAGSTMFTNAAREVEAYEREALRPEDWDLVPFPGWAALEPPASEGGPTRA